jgi:signal transduction histidine kinase/CheY-like chemotaxis protein
MFAVFTCLQHHDRWGLFWAASICVVAVVAGLCAFRRAVMTQHAHRAAWIATVAVVLGSGVWATHFIAMLAYHREMRVGFGLDLTAISLLVAIAGIGLGAAVALWRGAWSRLLGGAVCGAAIALMHFVGVSAMRVPARLIWDPQLAALAVAIAVCGAASAFAAAGDLSRGSRWMLAVPLLVVAICGLHFVAMSAVTLIPHAGFFDAAPYGRTLLSYAVAGFAVATALAAVALLSLDRISAAATFTGLRAALDGAPSAMALFDAEARLVIWNQAYAEVTSASSVLLRRGVTYEAILRSVGEAGVPPAIVDAALANRRTNERVTLEPFEGPHGRWLQPQLGPTSDGGFVVLLTDVSAQQHALRREAAARQAAEAANQAKIDFIANMSHEIRTPLNGVLGMAQIMAGGPLASDQRERLEIISRSGNELLVVIDGVLDFCAAEAGQLELEDWPFELPSWLQAVTAPFASAAARKGLVFETQCDPPATGAWRGDAGKLGKVLENLLSNALKFTEQGRVTVRVRADVAHLAFEVADTGLGIAADKQEMIFETFTQADASTTRRVGGTGLGLALCRRYAALMGADLSVRSIEGVGSTFTLNVPVQRIEAKAPAPEAAAASEDQRPLRVLAADDNRTNQLIVRALLEPLDVDLTVVGDGRQAVDACRTSTFDLILMDIQMPEMDGVEATRQIRMAEAGGRRARTPIVAVTANILREQVESYLAAGMDNVVAKPIEFSALVGAMNAALAEPRARAA